MNIIGLDIGRNNAVVAALSSFPSNVLSFYKENRNEFRRIKPDHDGFQYLENLAPTAIVMEPTGSHYSQIWYEWSKSRSIPVLWVGHADLAHQRGSYGFKNKRDPEDALSLACCALDDRFVDRHGNPRFLKFNDGIINHLRKLCLEQEQLTKLRNQTINQIRQRLAHEWPEACETAFQIGPKGYTALPAWIAGEHTDTRIKNRRARSIVVPLGIDFSCYTVQHCQALKAIELRLSELKRQIIETCESPDLLPYYQCLQSFGFRDGLAPLMVTQIYPFNQFLVEGRPFIEWEQTDRGKWQKRDRSLRSFQAYLGLSFSLKQSGDKLSKKFSGSTLIRSHLYIWLVSQMRGKGTLFMVDSPEGQQIQEKLKALHEGGITGSDKVTRLLFYTSRILWRKLLNEIPG